MSNNTIIQKRFNFLCWNCKNTYSLYKNVDLELKLELTCPYCGAKADVDFRPYHKRNKYLFRDGEESGIVFGDYQLPKVIPTTEPKSQ